MTVVSNDPVWWYAIKNNRTSSYFIVSASVGVIYDSALIFAQEVELVWRQRWSLMTVLYLGLRYIGMVYAVISILVNLPTFPTTDTGCYIMYSALSCFDAVVLAILDVIMIARLHAMYQGSRKMLIFLVIIFLVVNIYGAIFTVIILRHVSVEEFILSGTYQCTAVPEGNDSLLGNMYLMLATIWEILALCLASWIAVKHFRDLRRLGPSKGSTIGDCFRVLIKTHVVYFAGFVAVSCLFFLCLSPVLSTVANAQSTYIYIGMVQIFLLVQYFVLGPRLILGVREYHAGLAADFDTASAMTSISFQEHVYVATCSSV